MPRRPAILAFALGIWACRAGVAAEAYSFHHDNVMGTSMELSVRADDAPAARRAEDRTLREIDRLAAIFSNHDPASEFRRWQADHAAGPSKVSAELFEVLAESDSWRERSGGAFDPRVQALARLWSDAARLDRAPTRAELGAATAPRRPAPPPRAAAAAATDRMGRPAWRLDAATGTAERLSDAPLTLDAIAKGYIVERAGAAALTGDPAVRGVMLNVGGDLRAQGDPAWTVAIAGPRPGSETAEPLAWVEVKDRAVATSGQKHRGYRVEGRWHSHILDPRTGEPAAAVLAATVIAGRSADADALATILNVLPPDAGLRLADALPGVACLIVDAEGRLHRNAAWNLYERPTPGAASRIVTERPLAAGAEGGWGDEHELLVRFEINRPREKGRYRRPYVAVWVEDEAGVPVRNLLLWVSMGGPGPFEWLPDLKRWYADDRARAKANKFDAFQIAQPTRPPGEYSALWDGKDDRGKPLKAGTYTVLIEAVREQGGYGLIRKRVTLGDDAFVEELKGNDEIKSATLEYLRRGTKR